MSFCDDVVVVHVDNDGDDYDVVASGSDGAGADCGSGSEGDGNDDGGDDNAGVDVKAINFVGIFFSNHSMTSIVFGIYM